MKRYRYVILGGGMVAGYAAKTFVEQGLKPGELCIVTAEEALPYERPPLSKDFLAGKAQEEEIRINDAAFYFDHGIDLRRGDPVGSVNFDEKILVSTVGDDIGYEKLLIATGARVRMLGIPGAEHENIFYLRSVADSRRLRECFSWADRAVLIGGGYLGMEVSAVIAQKGIPVTVIVAGSGLQPRLFTPEMSAFFQRYFEERGVTFVLDAKARAINGTNAPESVLLDNGREVPGDLIVAGIGVTPRTGLFENGPLVLDEGIVTNEYLETGVPDVYAAGDVVSYWDVLFEKQRHIEHWNNAVEGGKHVASVMMGKREPYRQLPYFFSDVFDLSWEFWGDIDDADRVVYRGDVASGKFSAWWLKGGRLTAAFVMNRPDEERDLAQKWIKARATVRPERLEDTSRPLNARRDYSDDYADQD